jgi:hypothetical protein
MDVSKIPAAKAGNMAIPLQFDIYNPLRLADKIKIRVNPVLIYAIGIRVWEKKYRI